MKRTIQEVASRLAENKVKVKYTYKCVFVDEENDVTVGKYLDCLSDSPEKRRRVWKLTSALTLEKGDLVVVYHPERGKENNGGKFSFAVIAEVGENNELSNTSRLGADTAYIVSRVYFASKVVKDIMNNVPILEEIKLLRTRLKELESKIKKG